MIPILTPAEMASVDAAAPETVDVLVERAGAAVARAARAMLGGAYGRRVVVVAGKGNNGADGRAAARRLRRRGVRVEVVDAADAPPVLGPCDLVIDAAYGTGFRGTYDAPDPGPAPVLAVDIPSGVDGETGVPAGTVRPAARTVTFAALKPGLVLAPGRALAGEVEVADIGLDVSSARAHVVEAEDVAAWLGAHERGVDAHKWQSAVWVVGGSPGMLGAPVLAARGAQRAGAGYVRLSIPGVPHPERAPWEVVGVAVPATGWATDVVAGAERVRSLVVGPGLGRHQAAEVRTLLAETSVPVVLDGDGLAALERAGSPVDVGNGPGPVVLTPHDGELERLTGRRPGPDRFGEARGLAAATGAVVLLKGSTTIVAHPAGRVLVTTTGDARLATAGTGDVLAGVIGALLARGLDPMEAAAAGAWLHGRAGAAGPATGLVAGDVADRLPDAFGPEG